jgi:integrase
MAQQRSGSVEQRGTRWRVRVTLPDGRRRWVPLDDGVRTEGQARRVAADIIDRVRRGVHVYEPLVPAGKGAGGETLGKWFDRWLADRTTRRRLSSANDDRLRLGKHVLPALGARPVTLITRAELEALVMALDEKVRRGELAWKSAWNVWALVRRMFRDACRSKRADLRARADDPSEGIEGPDRGVRRAKAFLLPSEALMLLGCEVVPLRWRRAYAMALYTGLRKGELVALRPEDVTFESGVIRVHRAHDKASGETKATKTGNWRLVPIEPALEPLLRELVNAAGASGVLVDLPPARGAADKLREHMQRAGLERAELFANDKTRKPLTFHDLRGTCATWLAIRGEEPLKIQRRLGHTDLATTQGYIAAAEAVGVGRLDVFPPLPAGLMRGELSPELSPSGQNSGVFAAKMVEAPGIEPGSGSTSPVRLRA